MKLQLLRYISCPACHGRAFRVKIDRESGLEIEEGSLICKRCEATYPITRCIPRFVPSDSYVRSFSVEWNIFSRTQLDTGTDKDTHDTFAAKTGLDPEHLAGRVVLEAGCGMGRFLEIVSRNPTATVVGFDLSLAVEAAYQNVGRRSNVHIVQADIMQPPFRSRVFDFIYSIGVIHHTCKPRSAFMNLVPLLKKRGQLSVWVYLRYKRPPLSDLYRIATTRMPWSMVLAISRVMSKLYPLHSKWRYFQVLFPMSVLSDPERRVLDTFDWYSPKYQFKFTREEVAAWFRDAGFVNIQLLSTPIAIRGSR